MYLRRHGYNVRNLLVMGTGHEAVEFSRLVQDHSVLGVQVVGYLGDDRSAGVPSAMYWGPLEELPRVLATRVVDEVAICVSEDEWPLIEPLAQLAHEQGKLVRVPVNVPRLVSSDRTLEELDGTAVISYAHGPDALLGHALKRAFDLVVAVAALVLLSPLAAGHRRRLATDAGSQRDLPPGPGRAPWASVHDLQVPDHGSRTPRRGTWSWLR